MPGTKTKSRVTLLIEALTASRKAIDALKDIDLRTTRGELRDSIKQAREDAANLEIEVAKAIREDGEDLRAHRPAV